LVFSSQIVGTASLPQKVILTNSGTTAFSIAGVAIDGVDASDFTETNTCGASVAAGATCSIKVTFKPSVIGARTATLTIAQRAHNTVLDVPLSGIGTSTGATISLSPTSLAFGNQPVDVTSAVETVTVTNTGSTTLTITSFTFTGTNASDFAQTNNCGSSAVAGSHCTIAVLFKPSAVGARAAVLNVADSAAGSPQTVTLTGTGTHDVILTWDPSPTAGVVGYNVHRGTASGKESPTPLNSTLVAGTRYTDENVVAGATYYYVVTAVASDGIGQSGNSNEAVATVP
jgi:hypothetical protein